MFRLATFSAIGLAIAQGVRSQVSTASVFPIIDANGASLQGEIIGTGTDGTTYVLSGSPTSTNNAGPVTLTLVEDASHVSELAAESTGSASAEFQVECGFDSASLGVCTLERILANGANITTIFETDTGTVTLTPVAVSTSGATPTVPSLTQSASATQSSSGATSYVAKGMGSMLSLLLTFLLAA